MLFLLYAGLRISLISVHIVCFCSISSADTFLAPTNCLIDEEGNANNNLEEATNFSIKYLTSSKPMGLVVSNANNYSELFSFFFVVDYCVM